MSNEIAAAESDIDRIYEALGADDLTDEEEAYHIAELRAAVARRNALRLLQGQGE